MPGSTAGTYHFYTWMAFALNMFITEDGEREKKYVKSLCMMSY